MAKKRKKRVDRAGAKSRAWRKAPWGRRKDGKPKKKPGRKRKK